jgi:hypothetical protein
VRKGKSKGRNHSLQQKGIRRKKRTDEVRAGKRRKNRRKTKYRRRKTAVGCTGPTRNQGNYNKREYHGPKIK